MWEKVGISILMNKFFTGAVSGKLDEKNRVVLSQEFRYGLVEKGELEFALGLGFGGCLVIYRKSEIEKMAARLQARQYQGKFQKFLTAFFSTLHFTTCDKVGRFSIPPILKQAAGIDQEVVFAGVIDKIEIWPKDKYEYNLQDLWSGELSGLMEEALSDDVKEREYDVQLST